jgi:AraC family transcriptional regulator of adaptative response / DNA-3-methyladenine glycosylase II
MRRDLEAFGRFNDAFQATYRRSPTELRKGKRISSRRRETDAEITLRLSYRPPYDWQHIQGFLAKHAIQRVEVVTPSAYTRTAQTASGHALLQIRPVSNAHALEVRIQGAMPAELPPLLLAVRRMFDLTADPGRIKAVMRNDPLLHSLIDHRPGLRIPGTWDAFECCVRVIIGQHNTNPARNRALKELVERFGKPIATQLPGVCRLFPTPAALAAANLDDLGLTRTRREALRRLARGVCDKVIRYEAPGEEIRRMLGDLPGFARWKVEYIELRGLGEPDAFPFGDLQLRRLVTTGKQPLTSAALEAHAECWRPFRGYAAFQLWAVADDLGASNDIGHAI